MVHIATLAMILSIHHSTNSSQATFNVDAAAEKQPYSRMIFGGFIEHFSDQIYGGIFDPGSPLSDKKGFRKDVIAALKELKLSVVRWPGGCFASGYHWKEGIGKERKGTPDPVWGVTDPNTFGTKEFIEWCRAVECVPYICTNAGNGTPEEMRDWLRYCNKSGKDLRVDYWSIGNENWGGHEIGASTPEKWGPLVRKCADLMLECDSRIKLAAAGTDNRDWTLPLLKAAGSKLEYLAVHGYWLPLWGDNQMPDYLHCIVESEGPEQTIARTIGLLEESGFRKKIKIAFDEWNLRGWHHPGFPRKQPVDPSDTVASDLIRARVKNAIPSQYTMADALFSASFLNSCLRHASDVGMANIAPIVNTRGPLYVHKSGLVKRTTFHVLSLYANKLQSRVVKSSIDSPALLSGERSVPTVDGIATVNPAGSRWTVVLINRDPEKALSVQLNIQGVNLNGEKQATILDGDSPDAYNDEAHPNRVVPRTVKLTLKHGNVELPPHSLSLVFLSSRTTKHN